MKRKILITIGIVLFLSTNLFPCTSFYYFNKNIALVGNNEDWKDPFSKVWFIPGTENSFGKVYFGFKDGGVQGGMNEKGLFFDGFATKYFEVNESDDKELYFGNLVEKVMNECSTVNEVIEIFEKYNLQFMSNSMFFFADKFGNSAIIEGDIIIRKQGKYQVCTNFYQSQTPVDSISCLRFKEANRILENIESVDLKTAKTILANTHQEGKYPTQYSNVYDLINGKIYLYHYHNFENEVVINLEEELKKGKHSFEIPSLFPKSFAYGAYKKPIADGMKERFNQKKIFKIDSNKAEQFCGIYEIDPAIYPGYYFEVSMEKGQLYIETSFLDKSEIFPETESNFFLIGLDETFEFSFQKDIKTNTLTLTAKMYGLDLPATKID